MICEIRESDAEAFLALCKRLNEENKFMMLEPGERRTTLEEQEKRIREILSRDNQIIFVVEEEGALAGYLAAMGGSYARNKHGVHIVVGLREAFTSRGIGTALFQRLELTVMVPNTRGVVQQRSRIRSRGCNHNKVVNMIRFEVPGLGDYCLEHLVMDVNGTLAVDGQLIEGVAPKLSYLQELVKLHLLTADTHGKQYLIDQQLGLTAVRIQPGNEALQKLEYVRRLGSETVTAIGQGANDAEMLKAAKLGICVLSVEGVARDTLLACDLVAPTIMSALELLEKPARIKASLRR